MTKFAERRSPRQPKGQQQHGRFQVGPMLLLVFGLSLFLVLRQAWKVNQHMNNVVAKSGLDSTKEESVGKAADSTLDFTDVPSKKKLLSAARDIMAKHGVVAIQMLNEGYITMTKSWICNAKPFPSVLDRTLFIATDQAAYDALTTWDGTLHVVHVNYTAPKDMSYGQSTYFAYMLFRTRLIGHLLEHHLMLWLTEADAVWLRDPSAEVLATPGDMVVMSDRGPPIQSLQGGFQLLRPTETTRYLWNQLATQFADHLQKFQAGDTKQIGEGYGTEQQLMNELIRTLPDHHVTWLDPLHFCPGLYYIDAPYAATIAEPKVILNNFIIGNGAKIERAKQNGHWFLNDDKDGTCDANAAKILVVA